MDYQRRELTHACSRSDTQACDMSIITLTMDDANKITELFLNKYETLYNRVPTSDAELSNINEGIINHQLQDILITPGIISDCVKQLNKGKDDGNHGFKSDHLIQ